MNINAEITQKTAVHPGGADLSAPVIALARQREREMNESASTVKATPGGANQAERIVALFKANAGRP